MSAPTGNTNASHWTREKTIFMLGQIEALAMDEFSITRTLTQALLKLRCYKQLWSYWKKKWENDGDIMDHIYYIEQIFIHKLEEGALFRTMHPGACYFILRNNYGYNTKGESELPSHLMAEFDQPQETGPQTPATAPQAGVADTKATKDKPCKDHEPPYTDPALADRFGLEVRKHPHLYSAERSPALGR